MVLSATSANTEPRDTVRSPVELGRPPFGAMKRVFSACYAPSTLDSFLRSFTFGHVLQLDAVASRLAGRAPVLGSPGAGQFVFVDVHDTIVEVHGR